MKKFYTPLLLFFLLFPLLNANSQVVISQYYEGSSWDKWIELTNVGSYVVDFESPQLYLCIFANERADDPSSNSPNFYCELTGTLTEGNTVLFQHGSATLPSYASGTTTTMCTFNGDDIVILTTSNSTSAWADRVDVIGNGTDWGTNTSFYRNSDITSPNQTYTTSEWTEVSNSTVDNATSETTEYLGNHVYTPSNTPFITVSTYSLNEFYYVEGNGPTASQSFDVSGTNLTSDITVTPPTNYEISDDDASFQSTPITLTQSGGSVASTTLYTRLKAGLFQDEYNENISCASTGATSQTVVCSGGVFSTSLVINEIDADTRGTDREEFIEIYDGGMGLASLTGLVLVLYNGGDDASYEAYDLDGRTTDANGFFVIGSDRVANVDWEISGSLQNGPDAVALYIGNDTDFPDDTPVTTTNLVDAVVYSNGTDADDTGLLPLLNASQPQLNENDSGNGVDYSQQRMGNAPGGQRDTEGFQNAWPTPGEANYDAIWLGDVDYDWTRALNWVPSDSYPGASDKVFISGNAPAFPEVSSAETVGHVVLDHDAQLNGQENLTVTTVDIIHEITFSPDTSRWQYFTSPFSDLTPAGMASTNNRVDMWMATYNNSIAGDINDAWEFNLTPSTVLTPGKGYAVCTVNDASETGDEIYDADYYMYSGGTLVDASSAVSFSLLVDESGWNLIGNPFLAPIDWLDDSNIDYTNIQGNAAHLYDPTTGTYTTVSELESSDLIPPMQGFFVEASSAGNFDIPPDARVLSNAPFLKSESQNDHLTIGVTADSIIDKAVIAIDPMATNGFDKLDAHKLFATNKKIPQVFSLTGENEQLVINRINELPASIPMYLFTGEANEVTMSFPNLAELRSNLEITIELQGKTYQRESLSAGNIVIPVPDKGATLPFSVHLSENLSGVSPAEVKKPVLLYSGNGIQYKYLPAQPGTITLYTTSGQKIKDMNVKKSHGFFDIVLPRGIYLVNYESPVTTITNRIIVNR
ncbi:MAG: T9SS type A sorting domain-containing protein [Prolixibacteraceae bacterium]|nr:T9SS type A sorting domain-containing protein [Prolixibacteraceae bacterium]